MTVDSEDRCITGANVFKVRSVHHGNKDHSPECRWRAENEDGRGKLQMNLQASNIKNVRDDTEYNKLEMVDQDGNEVHFKMKQAAQIQELNKSYSERVGAPVAGLHLSFDGRRSNEGETPKEQAKEGIKWDRATDKGEREPPGGRS